MSDESDEKLLLEFIKWWKGYRAEFCMYPTPDDAPAFLSAREPPATEQRYWRIRCLNGKYAVTTCLGDGGSEWRQGEWRETRAEAEADGHANLPEWQPDAIPAAKPIRVNNVPLYAAIMDDADDVSDCACPVYAAPFEEDNAIPAALPTEETVPGRGK